MDNTRKHRDQLRSERGEGNLRFILTMIVLAYVAYLAVVNIPTWVQVQNLEHDMDEVARTTALEGVPVEKIKQRLTPLSTNYDVPQSAFNIKKDGPAVEITMNATKQINLLFTTYDWKINHASRGKAM